ncbi:MAG: ketoacyl-ACP synthase III [candidate division WOR-3 bacterium]|nr:ketoacyl-ACP synthase III [candidate division WOR-3 bacterium]MCX7948074.1 ketoacyl-ACP synthase III [candidate division WOR-3 bacterium]MDW8150988.1 beta-ketoacyl-ACP synthase III [candidate division WOR-3 bacterium]
MYSKILSIGSYVPKNILTNQDLEKIVETSDEWITERSGIKERRIASKNETSSVLGYYSSLKALERANLKPSDIDLVICATNTPDMQFPATGCLVASLLNIKVPCFDLEAGCPGVIYALEVARALIEAGLYRNILVVTSETLSRYMDWSDRTTCVLFGDGASSFILTRSDEPGIISSYLMGDGNLGELLKFPAGGSRQPASIITVKNREHGVKMQGREVFRYAVGYMADACIKSLDKANLTPDDIDWLVPHQANIRIIDATAEKLNIPKEKVYVNIQRYGNTSVASIGIALDEMIESNLLKKGQNVLIVSFGAGFTWGAMVFRYI